MSFSQPLRLPSGFLAPQDGWAEWVGSVGQCASLSSESWGLGLGRLCFPLCCGFSVLSRSPTPTVPVIPSNGEALGRLLGSQSWLQKLRSLKEMESPPPRARSPGYREHKAVGETLGPQRQARQSQDLLCEAEFKPGVSLAGVTRGLIGPRLWQWSK